MFALSHAISRTCISPHHSLRPTSRSFSTSSNRFVSLYSLIAGLAKSDIYKNYNVDLTPKTFSKFSATHLKKVLSKICAEKMHDNFTHVVSLKISADNAALTKCAIDLGFRFHHSNPEYSQLHLCMKKHAINQCTYPKYRTVSVGVTGVVFDKTLEKVLVVMEKNSPIKKVKPPTGSVDYGLEQETPLQCVVRELKEETGITVDPSKAILVGITWSNNYRGINPDISFTFAFVLQKKVKPIPQEEEIALAEWMRVEEFLKTPPEEKEKPWMLRQTVKIALDALKSGNYWKPKSFYWTSGKPVDLFSNFSKDEE